MSNDDLYVPKNPKPRKPAKTTVGSILLGAVFCLGLPGFWTAIAPVSYVYLDRAGEGIQATAYTCMFFCVPYRVQRVDLVQGSDHRIHAGEWSNDHDRGVDSRTRSEDEGFLVIKGSDQKIEVSTSPFNLKSREQAVKEFMQDQSAMHLRLICVSNWKFAVIGGAFMSLFTVLYLTGIFILIVRGILRLFGIGSTKKSDFSSR